MENSDKPLDVAETLANLLALAVQDVLDEEVLRCAGQAARGEEITKSPDFTPFEGTDEEKRMIRETHERANAWKKGQNR